MKLPAMKYKTFVWPNNPYELQLVSQRKWKEFQLPYHGVVFQDLGAGGRSITGKGVFYGSGALDIYQKLVQLFDEGGMGKLYLPNLTPITAIFYGLQMSQLPGPDRVEYSFEFREAEIPESGEETVDFYITAEGDTLWTVARKSGKTVDELLQMNPGLRSPLSLEKGKRLKI